MTAPATTTTPETLEQLDFPTPCSCFSDCCAHTEQHGQCGEPAQKIVTLHKLDNCNDKQCDPDGNTIGPICLECLARINAAVIRAIRSMRQTGGRPMCVTCQAPITLVSDVVRDVRPLR